MAGTIALVTMWAGIALIGAQILVSVVAAFRGTSGNSAIQNNSVITDLLKELSTKVPLGVLGLVCVLIAAVMSGGLEASVVFGGDPTPSPTP